jgi:hypothetical protein
MTKNPTEEETSAENYVKTRTAEIKAALSAGLISPMEYLTRIDIVENCPYSFDKGEVWILDTNKWKWHKRKPNKPHETRQIVVI